MTASLQAQCTILFVALSTFILAALFAERKKSEARLIESKMMLERERDNKLMNVRAITASIAHEIVQADSDFGAGCRSFAIC